MTPSKKTDEAKRRNRITVRFDDSEYSKISSEAKSVGVTVSKYMRGKALRGYVRVPKRTAIDAETISLLSKTGGLLKKIHNDSGGAYNELTAAILRDIRNLIKKIGNSIADDRETHPKAEKA